MERSRLLLYLGAWEYIQKAVLKKERDAADAYAGPNHSFPLYVSGKHLAAAWDLAGRADNPEEVRSNILAFARKHQLMHLLPLTAQHAAGVMDITRKSFPDGEWPDIDPVVLEKMLAMPPKIAKKAAAPTPEVEPPGDTEAGDEPDADDEAMRQFMQLMMDHAAKGGDHQQMLAIADFARQHGLAQHLPTSMSGMMAQKAEQAQPAEPPAKDAEPLAKAVEAPKVSKAPESLAPSAPTLEAKSEAPVLTTSQHVTLDEGDGIPVAKSMLVTKSWSDPRTGDVYIEGWVSTEARDQQKDIVPPEAFSGAMHEYMQRYAPLTTEHRLFPNIKKGQLEQYPVGHMQRVALVRDGTVLQEGVHPTDPAEFAHFPGYGTGVYGRGVINDTTAASQVAKGNMAGFSWVGRLKEYDALPDGGKRYGRIEPWLETTLSAFPVNSTARLVAHGRANSEKD